MIGKDISFKNINEYFKKEIFFSVNYTEDPIEKYITNFDELKTFILEEVHRSKHHYSALPEYILKELEL
jgi:hypothetical protein